MSKLNVTRTIGAAAIVATILSGCGAQAVPSTAPPATAAAAASPVSTAATLTGRCVTGFVTLGLDASTGTYQPAGFAPFPGPPSGGYGPHVRGGYQITLTNNGDTTAEVTGFSVVFYSGGAETGSADAGPFNTFITPGQSLAWTETTTVMDAGQSGAVDTSATCALVQWDHP